MSLTERRDRRFCRTIWAARVFCAGCYCGERITYRGSSKGDYKMTIRCTVVVLTLCFLSCASICWSQMSGGNPGYAVTTPASPTYVDNVVNITTPGSNAWHNTNTAIVQINTAQDGTTVGGDAQRCMWTVPSDYSK